MMKYRTIDIDGSVFPNPALQRNRGTYTIRVKIWDNIFILAGSAGVSSSYEIVTPA